MKKNAITFFDNFSKKLCNLGIVAIRHSNNLFLFICSLPQSGSLSPSFFSNICINFPQSLASFCSYLSLSSAIFVSLFLLIFISLFRYLSLYLSIFLLIFLSLPFAMSRSVSPSFFSYLYLCFPLYLALSISLSAPISLSLSSAISVSL